ncbi:MAG TPA: RNA polymerase sigma factor [Cyclobacteriaceae bacterium]|nr:RNA polymerase sigma factor [Cyclobacteriaceae bacterium]
MDQKVKNIHDELIAKCRAGDRGAHQRIYQLYSRAMYNVCYRITGNEDDAADVLQESFISAFNNLDHYRGDATFGAWLKRIVINKAINVLKRRKMEALPDDDRWDVPEESDEGFEDEDLTVERVKRAIQQLPDGYRSVLSLYLLEGYDHQEIGGILGVSESTSKSQLNRAKNKLRELLTGAI